MYQMNPQHTGRSPYAGPERVALRQSVDTASLSRSLVDPGDPRFEIQSSAAIAQDGTIYIGNFPGELLALRDSDARDGLDVLWRFHPPGASSFHATPALAPDGTVYLGFSTGGASRDARGTFYALRGPGNGGTPQVVWSVDLGPGRQTSSPTLGDDGTIYVASGDGKLFAIAPDSTVRWSTSVGPVLKSSPALAADGTVYIASMDGKLYAVSPPRTREQTEGSIRWTFEFGKYQGSGPPVTASVPPPGADGVGSGASPTVGPDGTIYVGANNSNLYAINPDGAYRWHYEAEREVAGIWSTPALSLDDRTLYFTANRGGAYALDRESGALRWRFNLYGSIYSSPTLDSQGTLYTGSTIGYVFALRSDNGQVIWDFDASAPVWTAPALRPDGTLVVADTNGRVMVLAHG
jgi:outer membrane protein assembly factor BamB